MPEDIHRSKRVPIHPFNRNFYDTDKRISSIGQGSLGGKAQGLALLHDLIAHEFEPGAFPSVDVNVPWMAVIRTGVFDAFMEQNDLYEIACSDASDERITYAFLHAELPFEVVGDLWAIIEQVHSPLAIRSSSLLEDSVYEPFAGIYATKMIPNDQYDARGRFTNLVEAIKYVYASTFYKAAKAYREATGYRHEDEKMGVIIQEVVGQRHSNRFYPELSGVAKSYNFYPVGRARQEDGVVSLALGLGKTIVDGGVTWTYSPAYPRIGPPYGSIAELLKNSQREFWAIQMGAPPAYSPQPEVEHLILEDLAAAEKDGTLRYLCSTYDPQSDRLNVGMGTPGPRALTFAPLLDLNKVPLNDLIKALLALCEDEMSAPVEIEFAMTFDPHRLGLLQVRPMMVTSTPVEIDRSALYGDDVLAASENVLGNGVLNHIQDVVYVIPERFDKKHTTKIAAELERINQALIKENRPYLLIVFGRLGSSNRWLGIPVSWGQISGARVIIEAAQEGFSVEMSQGSHFFHNLTSLGVSYFSMPRSSKLQIDWAWLHRQKCVQETAFLRHVRLTSPLTVKMDGRRGIGVIHKNSAPSFA